MSRLKDRVTALETRMDNVEPLSSQAAEAAASSYEHALVARKAHQANIMLLNEIRETQAEHTQRLDKVDQRLDKVDQRLDKVDQRLDKVDDSLGRLAVGMYSIERMLTHLVDAESDSPGGEDGGGTR